MADRMKVLLTTEGTYPFHQGGVSTWCDILVKQITSVDFVIFSVLMDPFVSQQFDIGKRNKLIKVPLWGTEEPNEHLEQLFSTTYLGKQRTTRKVLEEQFLPLFDALIEEVTSPVKNPYKFADTIYQLHDFFEYYDYKVAFKSELTWQRYKTFILENDTGLPEPDIYCIIQSLGWLYRFLNIINTPVPKTDVSHSSAAAFCGLPCVIAKMKYGTPFLLTEHGVYLREQYLSLSKRGYPSFLNMFLVRMVHSVTNLCYSFADQISPVCEYNTRWEKQMTDRHERIEVIYNGVDQSIFLDAKSIRHQRPTVVTVARIDPIKDIFTLIRAAQRVKQEMPDVRFLIYGSVSVPEYYTQCKQLVTELGLQETVEFMGHTTDVKAAYESGDIVAQSSISEAFPYSVIEAMLSGKPVVTTDVGGIPEAVGETGILVPPANERALADGILKLLGDEELRQELGEESRERALNLFTLQQSLDKYLATYRKLASATDRVIEPVSAVSSEPNAMVNPAAAALPTGSAAPLSLQQIYAERAYALLDNGFYGEALEWLERAIACQPESPAALVLAEDQKYVDHLLTAQQQLYAEKGYVLASFGYVDQAILQFSRAAELKPRSPAAQIFRLEADELKHRRGVS